MARSWTILARTIPVLALALAGACAKHHGSPDTTGTEAGRRASKGKGAASDTGAAAVAVVTPTPAGPAVVLLVAAKPNVAPHLTDSKGRAVYAFRKDQGGKSSCTGECARAWPPVTGRATVSPAAAPDSSAQSALIGETARDDGTQQVTYRDMPLYYFIGDQTAGDINGQGKDAFGGEWTLVTPDGRAVEMRAAPAPPENPAPPPPR